MLPPHKTAAAATLQAPNIFVVPPEEDNSAPWCCFDAAHSRENPHDGYSAEVPPYAPYLSNRSASGFDDTYGVGISSETRSIVDALGDAHDYSDHEGEQGPTYTDLEEEEDDDDGDDDDDNDDDGIESEAGCEPDDYHGHRYQQGYSEAAPRSQQQEVGNDSDVIEVIKVRRRSGSVEDTDGRKHGPSGSTSHIGSKPSFRSRATQALRSLKKTIRSASTSSAASTDSLSRSTTTKSKSSLKLRKPKTRHSSQAPDVFSPTESAPLSERPNTPDPFSRPSSRLAQLFSPVLRRRPSTASFASLASPTESSAPFPPNHEPVSDPSAPQPVSRRSSVTFNAPSRRSSASTQTRRESIYQPSDDLPTPTRKSYRRHLEEDEPTPSWRISVAHREAASVARPTSPTPAPRSISPTPSHRQANRRFSGLSLHKIFHRPSPNINSEPPSLPVTSAPSVSPATSTCPSLSSASTDESSERATPTLDSSPQTPTSLDDIEVMRTIIHATRGGGVSLDASAANNSYPSGAAAAAARTSIPSVPPRRVSTGTDSQRGSLFFGGDGNQQTRTSLSSVVSRGTTNSSGSVLDDATVGEDLTVSSPSTTPRMPGLDLKLDPDHGLGINLVPSSSGGLLSSNNMAKPSAETHRHARPPAKAKSQGGNAITRSLSLKNLSSKLGLGGNGKHQVNPPPVPPVPDILDPATEEGDLSMEMRLDSLHFDDLSFDADKFIAR